MKANKPLLTLNMNEKIYLAVAKKDIDKLSFVYTLACLNSGVPDHYDVSATPEIHTFDGASAAKVFYKTVEQLVENNENDKNKEDFFKFNEKIIENFLENTK